VKIAISGCAGIGKTTLASALAQRHKVQLVEEGYDGFFNSDFDFIKSPRQLKRKILGVLEKKNDLEDQASSFIADRCAVDLFNLWMANGLGADQKSTSRLYQRCRAYTDKYDFVFVLPWSAIPLKQISAPARRRRTMSAWFQLHNHANIIGLLHQWLPPERLVPIPFHLVDLEKRLEFASDKIALRNLTDR